MVYLDRVDTHWPLQIKLPVGTQVPFHCTASGKMYLSSLRQDKLARLVGALDLSPQTSRTLTEPEALHQELALTRTRGYSTDGQEFMDGMVAIAVPIDDDMGRLLTTLSIHAPAQRHDIDSLTQNLDLLKDTARQLQELV